MVLGLLSVSGGLSTRPCRQLVREAGCGDMRIIVTDFDWCVLCPRCAAFQKLWHFFLRPDWCECES